MTELVAYMINKLIITETYGDTTNERYFCYYESGAFRVFDRVTHPIREFINREEIKRDVCHLHGLCMWELTV